MDTVEKFLEGDQIFFYQASKPPGPGTRRPKDGTTNEELVQEFGRRMKRSFYKLTVKLLRLKHK